MVILIIALCLLGAAFLVFGYLIFFRGRYDLINGFEAERREGRKTERYARRVGLVEFICGLALIVIGILLAVLR